MLRIIESDPAPQSISPAIETTNVVGDAVDLVVGLLGEDAQVVQGHIENGGFQNNSTTSAQPTTKSSSRPRPTKWAHRICCIFTPSTWIDTLPTGEEVVRGFELIEKTRWALKCQICSEKMGTKVQCTKSAKCVKACHVTCALNTGFFFVDAQVSHGEQTYSLLYPANGPPEGLEISQDPTIVVLCKQHNPSYQKSEAERKARELSEKIGCFESNQEIKVRTSKGVFQVRFVSRDEERKSLKVVFEDGNLSEVSYNKVYFGPSVPAPASQSKSLNKPKDKPVSHRTSEPNDFTKVLDPRVESIDYSTAAEKDCRAQSLENLTATATAIDFMFKKHLSGLEDFSNLIERNNDSSKNSDENDGVKDCVDERRDEGYFEKGEGQREADDHFAERRFINLDHIDSRLL
ncbi:hypothetical protein BY996DRAFT_3644531 [Phakopsora pachyrhizi]|nr:hypothetical protein BY996DRAFT_3644531 [Phakopsora pachyrhizi]